MPKPVSESRRPTLAERADRHRLYEQAVQCAEAEVDFVDRAFLHLRGRLPSRLAEDFCGTGLVSREWVRRRPDNRAVGHDIDPEVLASGRRRHRDTLPAAQARRMRLIRTDVLAAEAPATAPVDTVLAMNFSWWLLKERRALRGYFARVRERLRPDGVFLLDAYGGYDAFRVMTEERTIDDGGTGFTYLWEQADYDPVSAHCRCHIHFAFPDGSRLERAFSYDWRLWTLPETREVLAEAGFRRSTCWWQGWTADGEPDGWFQPTDRAEPDAGWICYISAEP